MATRTLKVETKEEARVLVRCLGTNDGEYIGLVSEYGTLEHAIVRLNRKHADEHNEAYDRPGYYVPGALYMYNTGPDCDAPPLPSKLDESLAIEFMTEDYGTTVTYTI